jgi:hypothetical protein
VNGFVDDQLRALLRVKHYSYRTELCYLRWIEQYIRFYKTAECFRHPARKVGAGRGFRDEVVSTRAKT